LRQAGNFMIVKGREAGMRRRRTIAVLYHEAGISYDMTTGQQQPASDFANALTGWITEKDMSH